MWGNSTYILYSIKTITPMESPVNHKNHVCVCVCAQKVLSEMDNKTVSLVQKLFGLNTHSTRDVIFHPEGEGGLRYQK